MASKGCKYIQWAPFAATNPEPAGVVPNYGTPINLGALSKVTDSPSFNEAKTYGDNALDEYVNEFKECPIDIEVTELSNAVAAGIFGATLGTGEDTDLKFGGDDVAPYGGLAYIVCKQVHNVNKFQGIYFPKVKAAMQGEEYATKGDSVTLTGGKIKFTASKCNSGDWKIKSADLDTEAAAKTWVDAKIKAATI